MKTKLLHIVLTAIGLLLITKIAVTFLSFRQGMADKWHDTHMGVSAPDVYSSNKPRPVEAKMRVDAKNKLNSALQDPGIQKTEAQSANTEQGKNDIQKPEEQESKEVSRDGQSTQTSVKNFIQNNRENLGTQEVLLLNALMRMQQDMEQKQQAVENKTKVLEATKKSVEQQVAQLQALRNQIDNIVNKQQAGHEQQLQSLVKVYENMRPKEAALIFNQMEVVVLVELIKHMKEAKVAAILSYMNPVKARDLSIRLIDNQDKVLDKKTMQSPDN